MKLWELINMSDPYTFRAPTVQIAGCCAVMLSNGFGAKCLDPGSDERTPVLFGWDDWIRENNIDSKFINEHAIEIADAFDSFLIGSAAQRDDVESMLALLPEDKRQQWKAERQGRCRTSMNQIGETAYDMATEMRERAKKRSHEQPI